VTGKQKAAMLLMNLDTATASELLRGLPPEDVQAIGLELAKIDVSGHRDRREEAKIVQDFYVAIRKQTQGFSIKGFLNDVLVSILGKERAEQIQSQIKKVTEKKDPFVAVRSASTDELVLALKGEHHQTIAVILSELPPKKSQEVLSLLNEDARLKAVCKMTNLDLLGSEVKQRIASMVSEKLKTFQGETLPEDRQQTLRKLAITLSGLERDLRDRLMEEIRKQNEETCKMVRNLMITWEDIPSIADRSLQECLRSVDSKKLGIALFGADEEIVQKIKSNMSERAAAMLEEEVSLMQEPLQKEIIDAREEVVKPMREANEAGTLRRIKQ
jgi:flagellar motor switch protein FliG